MYDAAACIICAIKLVLNVIPQRPAWRIAPAINPSSSASALQTIKCYHHKPARVSTRCVLLPFKPLTSRSATRNMSALRLTAASNVASAPRPAQCTAVRPFSASLCSPQQPRRVAQQQLVQPQLQQQRSSRVLVRAGASETASSGSSGAPEGQVSSAIIESMEVCCTEMHLMCGSVLDGRSYSVWQPVHTACSAGSMCHSDKYLAVHIPALFSPSPSVTHHVFSLAHVSSGQDQGRAAG